MAKRKDSRKKAVNSKGSKKSSSPGTLDRLRDWWKGQSISLRFLGIFFLCMGLFYLFYFSDWNVEKIHPHIVSTQASIGAFLLNIFGQGVRSAGEVISGNEFSMSVSGGCDGIEVTALLIAGILAFPSSWPEKMKGLLYGVSILTVLNLLRLPMLYFVGATGNMALFDFFHVQGGFVIFISITVLIWCYWIIQVLNRRKTQHETA